MIKEKCSCGNMVAGVFTPSDTRRYLTSLAKKGGMKAVLAALGSVVPGLGNIGGLLVGSLIDLKYGKDVERLIDKVADIFEDKKVYVFNCPNCGKTWVSSIDVENDEYEEEYDFVEELLDDSDDEILTHDLSMQMQEIEAIYEEALKYDVLSDDFHRNALDALTLVAEEYDKIDNGFYTEECDSDVRDVLKSHLKEFYTSILNHIAHACEGSMNSPIPYDKSALDKSFSMEVHGLYPSDMDDEKKMVVGVIRTGTVHTGDNLRLKEDNDAYAPVEAVVMFGKKLGSAEAGDVCALILPSYYVDEDGDKDYYKFPKVITGFNSSIELKDEPTAMTKAEEEYVAEYKACLEDGTMISDKERRLLNRLRDSLGISTERGAELEAQCVIGALSDEEKEYVAEVKACLADGGVISDRERRLLSRLAKSLGISEERMQVLELQCN